MELNLKALAKINLGLDVLRRREDGYHEVRMVMQTIHLYDRISLRKTRQPGIRVRTNLYYLPTNENNLVYRAAKLLMDEFDLPGGLWIDLKKYIPVAAGMAGGSSDAAAVLFGLNRMYGLRLSREALMEHLTRGSNRGGRALLSAAGDGPCGGHRREADTAAAGAEMSAVDCEAADCRVNEDGL